MIGDVGRRVTSASFIGREAERELLERLVAETGQGSPSHVLLGGEAGVGKSRLATFVGAQASESGWLVLSGGCIDLGEGGLPFGPYVELLRGWTRRTGAVDAIAIAGAGAGGLGTRGPG